ncbi:hypothetical protein [Oceanobacillus kapialis]|uniref:Uncharacterized protein n=1 Tax=Oceanobacillus kapialis TaxID=481353 RepID=A0ABW5PW04_9BACI
MEFYPEMFISKWHLVVVFLAGIVWIGLVIGGYGKKTVITSTLKWLVAFYIIVTVPVALSVMDAKHIEEEMITGLDETYASNKGSVLQDHLAAYVSSFEDEDGDFEIVIYAGNYHAAQEFVGDVHIVIAAEDGSILREETYEEVSLEPGEKIELDSYYTTDDAPDTFQYWFE